VSENATRKAVDKLYDAYRRRDIESVAELLHEDIDWVIYSPIDVFPFAGQRHGRAAVLEAITELSGAYSLESHNPEMQIVEGDRAAVMADIGYKQLASGRILRFRVADFLRIQDGQLVEFRQFADSFDLVEQAIGHTVEI
jgi:ketosteroid isomerase-like protein